MNKLIIRNIEKTKKTLFNVITQFFNDVRSKYNLVPTSNPSGVIHKLKNKLNKIIKLLVLTNNESYKRKKLWKTVTAISARHKIYFRK